MKTLICPACGARLTVKDGETKAKCQFCDVETLLTPESTTPPPCGNAAGSPPPFSNGEPSYSYEAPGSHEPSFPPNIPVDYSPENDLPTLKSPFFSVAKILFLVLVAIIFGVILFNACNVFRAVGETKKKIEEQQDKILEQREEILRDHEEFFN
ncbi:MAG: hypothetical protein IKC69_03000 [Clostridia bacterium]|nr:hypothetical protein [Clostridia bacterium]